MPKLLNIGDLSRSESAAVARKSLVILPVGAMEQHGPYLPLDTDSRIVGHIARAAGTAVSSEHDVILSPTIWLGASAHHLPFGGTVSLSSATYYHVIMETLSSLSESGYRRVFLLNGHGGNHELIQVAMRDACASRPIRTAGGSYWQIAAGAIRRTIDESRVPIPGHAGYFEAALLNGMGWAGLGLEPGDSSDELPSRDHHGLPGHGLPFRYEASDKWTSIGGFTDDPRAGVAEQLGGILLEEVCGAVATAMREFLSLADQEDR